ncbi:MAG: type II secretion system F family protein [Lachnospiraceae bacterium]|nr:type II secretion system F family protein [Lachnospiraceae bacterium]
MRQKNVHLLGKIHRNIQEFGAVLVEKLRLDQPGKGKQELQQELIALSAGSKTAVKNYYVRKVTAVLMILGVGLTLAGICYLVNRQMGGQTTFSSLLRPGYGEGDKETALSVQVEDESEAQVLTVTVQERKYTDEEKQKFLDLAFEELENQLLGENESLDVVRTSLVFPESLQEGVVQVSWATTPYGVIGSDGSILSADNEEGTLVEIQAVLSCGSLEAIFSVCANVFPPVLTEEEQLLEAIREEVARADEESSYENELTLPASAAGRKLTWVKESDNPYLSVLALTLVLAVCVYLQMDNQVHNKAEARKKQLLLDYPDLMWKMTMLLGAGMSIRGVFTKISEEYERGRAGDVPGEFRFVYEEVTFTCHEMQSGIGEAQAYERFGKRCQLPEYIRIGSVLSQNLRKGAKGLAALLESEAESSLNDRRNHARKIGEQAGTKLLLPMILMLGIVLTVLMVPAFLSF